MNRKLLIKYLLMYLSVIMGIILFSNGVVNLFSSLLLFLGGYVAIKNTFDYRILKKNIESVKIESGIPTEAVIKNSGNKSEKTVIKPKKADDIIGLKRTRRYTRVRRKY